MRGGQQVHSPGGMVATMCERQEEAKVTEAR